MGGRSTRTVSPEATSQMRMVLSSETLKSNFESELNSTLLTPEVCPAASRIRIGLLGSSRNTSGDTWALGVSIFCSILVCTMCCSVRGADGGRTDMPRD